MPGLAGGRLFPFEGTAGREACAKERGRLTKLAPRFTRLAAWRFERHCHVPPAPSQALIGVVMHKGRSSL
jgi:hypothetical protein